MPTRDHADIDGVRLVTRYGPRARAAFADPAPTVGDHVAGTARPGHRENPRTPRVCGPWAC